LITAQAINAYIVFHASEAVQFYFYSVCVPYRNQVEEMDVLCRGIINRRTGFVKRLQFTGKENEKKY
jgi:hypothetical protein